MSKASKIIGIVSLPLFWIPFIGSIVSGAGAILSAIVLYENDTTDKQNRKRAVVGLVTSVTAFALSIAAIVLYVLVGMFDEEVAERSYAADMESKEAIEVVDTNQYDSENTLDEKEFEQAIPTAAPAPTVRPMPTATPEPTPRPTPIPKQRIRSGMYEVGKDVRPGTYKGEAGGGLLGFCYWERLKNLDGNIDSIIANGLIESGQFYVSINASDRYFKTDCDLEPQ